MSEPDNKIPVILLDCDLRNTEGIISTFGRKKIPIIAISSVKNTAAFRSRFIYKKYISPNINDGEAYLNFLLGLEEKGVIIYSSDTSAEFISKYQQKLKSEGYLLNVPSHHSFIRGFDKDKIFEECNQLGIPTIKTVKIKTLTDVRKAWDEIGPPMLLKPTRLAGGRFMLIREDEDIKPVYKKINKLVHSEEFGYMNSGLIAQEYIEYNYDDLYCCESYYSTKSRPVGFLSIRKLRPNINRDGTTGSRLYAGITIEDKTLENYSKSLLDALNWKGFAHIDWLYSKKYKSYLLCEINPRLPGFSNFLTKNGFDMAWFYYADIVGIKIKKPQIKKSLYFEALRIPGDITNGIYSILKGYIKPWSFIHSYLLVFSLKYNVCFDVFYGNDPFLTLNKWYLFLVYLLKRPFRKFNSEKNV